LSLRSSYNHRSDLAVRLAAEVGIILIGFERAKRMNVYANEWRVYNGKRNL